MQFVNKPKIRITKEESGDFYKTLRNLMQNKGKLEDIETQLYSAKNDIYAGRFTRTVDVPALYGKIPKIVTFDLYIDKNTSHIDSDPKTEDQITVSGRSIENDKIAFNGTYREPSLDELADPEKPKLVCEEKIWGSYCDVNPESYLIVPL